MQYICMCIYINYFVYIINYFVYINYTHIIYIYTYINYFEAVTAEHLLGLTFFYVTELSSSTSD